MLMPVLLSLWMLSLQTAVERATTLVAAIEKALERPITDDGRATAAAKLAELDAMGQEALTQKVAGLRRFVSLNRSSASPDVPLLRRFLVLYAQLPAADREPFRFSRYLAYEILAEQAHRAERFDDEIAILREGVALFSGDPGDSRERQITEQLLDKASMVGKAAPSIVAEEWLNAPSGGRLPMTGGVTLVEFTAHWCGPCRDSYPGLLRLVKTFGPTLRVALVTKFWGYFGAEKNIAPERELVLDRKLFLEDDALPFPIAISPANEKAYFVQPIPHFVLIDAMGVVRRVDVGWDNAYQSVLEREIRKLLAPPRSLPVGVDRANKS